MSCASSTTRRRALARAFGHELPSLIEEMQAIGTVEGTRSAISTTSPRRSHRAKPTAALRRRICCAPLLPGGFRPRPAALHRVATIAGVGVPVAASLLRIGQTLIGVDFAAHGRTAGADGHCGTGSERAYWSSSERNFMAVKRRGRLAEADDRHARRRQARAGNRAPRGGDRRARCAPTGFPWPVHGIPGVQHLTIPPPCSRARGLRSSRSPAFPPAARCSRRPHRRRSFRIAHAGGHGAARAHHPRLGRQATSRRTARRSRSSCTNTNGTAA